MIANCSRCGQMYTKQGSISVCPECIAEKETVFDTLKSYLVEHKQATLAQVVAELETDPILVTQLIKEGRLYLLDTPNFGINCGRCGKLTNAGGYCKDCQQEIAKEFANATIKSVKRLQDRDKGPGYYTRK